MKLKVCISDVEGFETTIFDFPVTVFTWHKCGCAVQHVSHTIGNPLAPINAHSHGFCVIFWVNPRST